ncbi:4Fe-4S binding protein [Zoogloea sp. 1C4]|uniref:4Fe-4S binding protein n=1 Tax=Zoogloea sp. 1C4 TaxID=2570190 RepID=UPI001290B9A2|nr:4Fe-4S binding protein [Zoogloea sp. 1C4]
MNARVIPIKLVGTAAAPPDGGRQRLRRWAQAGFFVLFVLAPVFNLLRYDLVAGHAWLLGFEWHAGLEDFSAGRIDALGAVGRVIGRVLLPILVAGGVLIWVSWKWGRLYCGWLCPHFSVVETINAYMRRATGKPSVWESRQLPPREPDGRPVRYDSRWWFITVPLAVGFAFVWAVVLLTYLLPPFQVYGHLLAGTPTRNEFIFITAGTVVLSAEFLFARHLFCRYACAVGMFQSLAWMGNREAMVVGFERDRAADCASCYSACDHVCPMRLKPRNIKRTMFTCTQCAQCVSACETTQQDNPRGPLLQWVAGEAARHNEAAFAAPKPERKSQ